MRTVLVPAAVGKVIAGTGSNAAGGGADTGAWVAAVPVFPCILLSVVVDGGGGWDVAPYTDV